MKRFVCCAPLIAGLALICAENAQGQSSPPDSSAFGRTLTEWMETYWNFQIGGIGTSPVGRVVLMPIPSSAIVSGSYTYADPAIRVGSMSLTLPPGSPFVLPQVVWYGESYIPGLYSADEDPVLPAELFFDVPIWVTITKIDKKTGLPGRTETVIDSRVASVEPYYFFTPLDIVYDEPTSYGSTGAIFVQGIGFVHGPLAPGNYVLQLKSTLLIPPNPDYLLFGSETGLGVEYNNTWNITVTP